MRHDRRGEILRAAMLDAQVMWELRLGSRHRRPVFYYDISSAYAYLAAERIGEVLPGVPGVPTVVIDGAVFWGDDRLEEAAAAARPS